MTRVSTLIWMRRKMAEKRGKGLCTLNYSCKRMARKGFVSCDYHREKARNRKRKRKIKYKQNKSMPTFKIK